MTPRPKLLDLFCGAGGAGMGYFRAGFDVTGVDIKPQPRYPFAFVQRDAMELLEHLTAHARVGTAIPYDAIHASPPCQSYLNEHFRVTPSGHVRLDHPKLIGPVRDALNAIGRPWILENIESAISEMIRPVRLCGTSFGLPLRRHRLFECSEALLGQPCRHDLFTEAKYPTQFRPKPGQHSLSRVVQVYGNGKGAKHWPAAMGIDWMNRRELANAIPPAYTEHLGRQLLNALERVA